MTNFTDSEKLTGELKHVIANTERLLHSSADTIEDEAADARARAQRSLRQANRLLRHSQRALTQRARIASQRATPDSGSSGMVIPARLQHPTIRMRCTTMAIRGFVTIAAIALSWGMTGHAAESSTPAPSAASKQSREQMALAHEKMASCLRSERPLAECHSELMRDCKAMKGDQGCGMKMMMGKGEHDHGTTAAPKESHSEH